VAPHDARIDSRIVLNQPRGAIALEHERHRGKRHRCEIVELHTHAALPQFQWIGRNHDAAGVCVTVNK
jgi:hypothetical protein